MTNFDSSLRGKFALITGASRGLGERIARVFWRAGASLCLVARSRDRLAALASQLTAQPGLGQALLCLPADLLDPAAPERIVIGLQSTWARLDILVNNAAIQGPIGRVEDNPPAEWNAALQVNLLAPVRLCQLIVPWMRQGGGGRIVNLSGGGATGPRPNFSAYATAKAGLVRFSETLAAEVEPDRIQVNCVAPGAMNTHMLQAVVEAGVEKIGGKEWDTARKVAQADDRVMQRAAELCLYLSSERSAGITGRLISAVWDPWEQLDEHLAELRSSDIYTLRRIVPRDRGASWE